MKTKSKTGVFFSIILITMVAVYSIKNMFGLISMGTMPNKMDFSDNINIVTISGIIIFSLTMIFSGFYNKSDTILCRNCFYTGACLFIYCVMQFFIEVKLILIVSTIVIIVLMVLAFLNVLKLKKGNREIGDGSGFEGR